MKKPRRITISLEVEAPPGVTIAKLRRKNSLHLTYIPDGEDFVNLPIIQVNGVAQAGN